MTGQPAEPYRRVHENKNPGITRGRIIATLAVAGAVVSTALGAFATELFALSDRGANGINLVVSATLILVGLLVIAHHNKLRRQLEETAGTVYFLRYQFPGSANWHTKELRRLQTGSMDLSVISRDVCQQPAPADALDFEPDVTDMVRALEAASNADTADTGFHFMPDMLWPAAMSLGSQLYGYWSSVTLDEAPFDAEFAPKDAEVLDLRWELLKPPDKPEEWFDPLVATWSAGKGDNNAGIVLVTANLTDRIRRDPHNPARLPSPPLLRLTEGVTRHWYGVGAFTGPRPTTINTPCSPVAMDERELDRGAYVAPDDDLAKRTVHPWVATARCVQALRRALHEHPGETVFFAAQLPKTVGLAVGWHLTRDELTKPRTSAQEPLVAYLNEWEPLYLKGDKPQFRCTETCCRDPWARLVLLNFDQGTHKLVPTRAHPSQPPLGVLGALGAALSPPPAPAPAPRQGQRNA